MSKNINQHDDNDRGTEVEIPLTRVTSRTGQRCEIGDGVGKRTCHLSTGICDLLTTLIKHPLSARRTESDQTLPGPLRRNGSSPVIVVVIVAEMTSKITPNNVGVLTVPGTVLCLLRVLRHFTLLREPIGLG